MIPYASSFTRLPQLDLQFKSGGTGIREGKRPSDCDPNTRKARKIKIKRKKEGRIEGKIGIWEQLSQK